MAEKGQGSTGTAFHTAFQERYRCSTEGVSESCSFLHSCTCSISSVGMLWAYRWVNRGREGHLAGHTLGRLEEPWGIAEIPNRNPRSSRERSCRSLSCSSSVSVRMATAGCQALGCCSRADKNLYLPLFSFSGCHQWSPFAVTHGPEHFLSVAADLHQTNADSSVGFPTPAQKNVE